LFGHTPWGGRTLVNKKEKITRKKKLAKRQR
jgi:hypothetical protein